MQNMEIQNGGRLIDLMSEGGMTPPNTCNFVSWDGMTGIFMRLPKWINSMPLPVLSRLACKFCHIGWMGWPIESNTSRTPAR